MDEREYEALARDQAVNSQASETALKNQQLYYAQEQQEKGIAEAQLDVEEILDNIYNLLQGKEYKLVEDGSKKWVLPAGRKKTLSEWGIHRIMQTVRFHINKNNLLSNYKEEQINRLMLRFTSELNDLILLKYEKLFSMPSFEECKEILEKKIKEKKKLRRFALDVAGKEATDEQIEKEVTRRIEGRIEKELQNIKEMEMKERLKEYGLIIEELEAAVYATYNRAWKGEERGSLRRHSNYSQVLTQQPFQQKQPQGGIFNWKRS